MADFDYFKPDSAQTRMYYVVPKEGLPDRAVGRTSAVYCSSPENSRYSPVTSIAVLSSDSTVPGAI